MHEHVICNSKDIMGSAQVQCYNAHVMQCMMFESHFHQAHPKNFTKTPPILKTPRIPKVRSENMNCMIE